MADELKELEARVARLEGKLERRISGASDHPGSVTHDAELPDSLDADGRIYRDVRDLQDRLLSKYLSWTHNRDLPAECARRRVQLEAETLEGINHIIHLLKYGSGTAGSGHPIMCTQIGNRAESA